MKRECSKSRSTLSRATRSIALASMVLHSLSSQPLTSAFVSRAQTSSRPICPLHVLSPVDAETKHADDNEKNPLFQIDDEDDSGNLFQVEKLSEVEEVGSTTITPTVVDSDDMSFYYRDDDDMLTEREDRLYMDENGIRRKVERCILVGVEDLSVQRKARRAEMYYDPLNGDADPPCFTLEESMIEMRELIKTAGLDLSGEITQRLQEVNPRTYIGTGKVKEAQALMEEEECTTIVFDAELSPGQQKTLENIFNRNVIQNDFLVQEREVKVIDRTALILDIFAQHAKTREGKLQVDLALHEYRKPRPGSPDSNTP